MHLKYYSSSAVRVNLRDTFALIPMPATARSRVRVHGDFWGFEEELAAGPVKEDEP
jgi:hypothetical protein